MDVDEITEDAELSLNSEAMVDLDSELSSLQSELPVTIDFVNQKFMVFGAKDNERLRRSLRIICEKEPQSRKPPIVLAEQVATLFQYGLCEVRRLKSGELPYDSSIFVPDPSSSTSAMKNVEEVYERARQIAIGRKAKELKRKAVGPNANAKALKIHKSDLEGISVSEDDVNEILHELNLEKPAEPEESERLAFPRCSDDPEMYEILPSADQFLPIDKEFRLREIVFHDLWRRGFYVSSAIRFGADYLLYEGHPDDVHASFILHIIDSSVPIPPLKLITITRLASQVKKKVILATVSTDNHIPHYMVLQWFKPYENCNSSIV